MADIEKRVETVETKVISLEQQVNNVITKMDMFIEESRAARERRDAEMREMREKQDADVREIYERQDANMREMRERRETDMREIKAEINNIANSFRIMNITVIIGIAAMVIAVLLK